MYKLLFSFTCLLFLSFTNQVQAQEYKDMMGDIRFNIHDVIQKADEYFETHSKGKGSGWKGYQRWKYDSELLFEPSGDRSDYKPEEFFQEYNAFIKKKGYTETPLAPGTVWTEMGPSHANNILNHYAPGLGRIETLFVNPTDSNIIYVGARNGGFWRSTDHGGSWTVTTDFLSQTGVISLAVTPSSNDTVIITTKVDPFINRDGIYYSFDGGFTWTASPLNTAFGSMTIRKLAYNPLRPNESYATTNKGLFRSWDHFQTWDTLIWNESLRDFEIRPTTTDILYTIRYTNPDSVLKSTDDGQTWVATRVPSMNRATEIAVTGDDPDYLYAANSDYVFRSTDANGTWTTRNSNPPDWFGSFGVLDSDKDRVLYGGIDTHLSDDGGTTFTKITTWSSPFSATYIHADLREVTSIGDHFYVGTDGYFSKSIDGGYSWERKSDGVKTKEFYRIGVSPTHNSLVIGGSQDNGTSFAFEGDWYEWLGADGMECAINRSNPNTLYGEWQYGGLHRSYNQGVSRTYIKPGGVGNGSWITPFVMDWNHPQGIIVGYDSLYRTWNDGGSWTNIGTFPGDLDDLAIWEKDSDFIYAVFNKQIWRTTDGGTSWTEVTGSLPNRNITDVAINPNDPGHILLTFATYSTGQQIYMSQDSGNTYTNISFDMPKTPAYTAIFQPKGDNRIYMGTRVGVFTLHLDSTNWNSYNHNFPLAYTRELEIHRGSNMLRAGTYGRGLWEAPLIGREFSPKIMTIETHPFITQSLPTEHNDFHLRSIITDNGNIASAWVDWSVNNTTFSTRTMMSLMNLDTFQTATRIPNMNSGDLFHFIVTTVDNSGDTTCSDRIVLEIHSYFCGGGPLANAGADVIICAGDSTTLSAQFGSWLYEWNQGVGDGRIKTVSPTATTDYSVKVSSIYGCNNFDTVRVTVNATPVVNLGPDTTICQGDPLMLDAGNAGSTFSWNTGLTSQTINPSVSGTYYVDIFDANNCSGTDTVEVNILALPSVGLDFGNNDTTCSIDPAFALSGGLPAGGSYSGSGVSAGMFDPASAGPGWHIISYTAMDSNGCSNTAMDSLYVNICTGRENQLFEGAIAIYPNPSGDPVIHIDLEFTGKETPQQIDIQVIDARGRMVHGQMARVKGIRHREKLELPTSLQQGVYIIRVMDLGRQKLIYSGQWQYLKK